MLILGATIEIVGHRLGEAGSAETKPSAVISLAGAMVEAATTGVESL
jgi:hypothetical protein